MGEGKAECERMNKQMLLFLLAFVFPKSFLDKHDGFDLAFSW